MSNSECPRVTKKVQDCGIPSKIAVDNRGGTTANCASMGVCRARKRLRLHSTGNEGRTVTEVYEAKDRDDEPICANYFPRGSGDGLLDTHKLFCMNFEIDRLNIRGGYEIIIRGNKLVEVKKSAMVLGFAKNVAQARRRIKAMLAVVTEGLGYSRNQWNSVQ